MERFKKSQSLIDKIRLLTLSCSSLVAAPLPAFEGATFLTAAPAPATVLDLGAATEGRAEVLVELLATLTRPERAGTPVEEVGAVLLVVVPVVEGRPTVEGLAAPAVGRVVEEEVAAPVVDPTGFLTALVVVEELVAEGLDGDEEAAVVEEPRGRRTDVVEVVLATLERGAAPGRAVDEGVVPVLATPVVEDPAVETLPATAVLEVAVPETGGLAAVLPATGFVTPGRVVPLAAVVGFVPT